MTLYETIFVRRSVRQYDQSPLDEHTLDGIRQYLADTARMEGQHAAFKIVTADEVSGGAAPYYILGYCDQDAAAYANLGYVLQKTDLHLQSAGFGSLWMGMAKPKEKEPDYSILLAFGNTDVPPRLSGQGFNRLPISEISDTDNAVAEAVRLAPSAVNSQPWKLFFEEGKVALRYFGRGMMKLVLKKKLNKIDLGIAARHAELALQNEGKEVTSVLPVTTGKDFSIELRYR